MWKHWQILFSWTPKSLQTVTAATKLKLAPWKKSSDKLRHHIPKQRNTLLTLVCVVKAFPVLTYSCESWTMKNAECWRIDAFELWCWNKTLESPLDCKEIQPVQPKGDQSWVFIGRTAAEAETPVLWPPDSKSGLTGKEPEAGNDWRQKGKGAAEDEMII